MFLDIRYGLRTLFKHDTALAMTVVFILGLGVGATTTIFSLVNSIVLRPLPYQDPAQVVSVYENNLSKGLERFRVSPADFVDWKDQNQVFSQVAAVRFKTFLLTGTSEPDWLSGAEVSATLFPLLGVKASLGQPFLSEQEQSPNANVVMISHALWQRSFGSNLGIIGQTLMLNGQGYIVTAVMPRGFEFPKKLDVWVPLTINPGLASARKARFLQVVGRLKDHIKLKEAQAGMNVIAQQLEQAHPETNAGWGITLIPLYKDVVGSTGRVLMIFLCAVGFVLLITCANVANLLLARATAREREVAIRAALGAGRSRLVKQVLTESVLLAFIGGALGFLLSLLGLRLLIALAPADIPRMAEVHTDGWILIFTLALCSLTGIGFGMAPALVASKPNLCSILKEGAQRMSGGIRGYRLLKGLVVLEIALAVILLTGASLMIRSFVRLQNTALGFNPSTVLTVRVSLPESRYPQGDQQKTFFQQLLERTAALPGVNESGLVTELPIGGANSAFPIAVEGRPPASSEEQPIAFYNAVSSNYFRAMSIPVVRGRYFTENDEGDRAQKILIIDETLAHRFWPNEDPIGKRLVIMSGKPTPHEIVGIVKNVQYQTLESNITIPAMYVPYLQSPESSMTLVVRDGHDPVRLADSVRDEVRRIDKDQPVSRIDDMDSVLAESLSQKRFYTLLLSVFAIAALLLAAVGIYGVMSYSVTRRTHEIGIRMALGAGQATILKMVIGQNLILVVFGVLIGLAGAFALSRFLASLLYEVTATDPFSFTIVVVILMSIALLVCYLPARRAIKVDPMVALRYK